MKAAAYVLAALAGFAGLIFLLTISRVDPGQRIVRIIFSVVCLAASFLIVKLARKPVQHTHVHKMELDVTGDVNLEQITCKSCAAELSSDSVTVAAGAVYVKCEYCGSQYQIEEAPKW